MRRFLGSIARRRTIPVLFVFALTFSFLACASDGDGSGPGSDVGAQDLAQPDASPDAGVDVVVDAGKVFLEDPPSQLGDDRPADYFVPDSYAETEGWPLLILLHGYSATGWLQDGYFGTSTYVDERGFFLITPDGTRNSGGTTFWNGTDACCDFEGSGVDDGRVYLMGHSNGGYMSYRMACDAGDRITALVSLAGATYYDDSKCTGTTPVSVLQVHGTADQSVPYGGEGIQPGALTTATTWAARNGCASDSIPAENLDLEVDVDGAETVVLRWDGCADGTSVELWSIEDGTHVPALNASFTPLALDYLLSKSR
jgi:polyhydroxybutyrate depolymerase